MHGSRPASWRPPRRWQRPASIAITLLSMLASSAAALARPSASNSNPDWPCRQILVGRLSPAAVWSGPSIEGIAWRNDQAIADTVGKLAPRRIPLEEAERMIGDFARSQGAAKGPKLTAVFAGLYETLDGERSEVIEGLLRFGAKQKELADKIRAENALARELPSKEPLDTGKKDAKTVAQDLEWDLRIFDERRQSLAYVCESPTLIEQRLFALAKIIQRKLE